MTENEKTTVQIDRETLAKIKELATNDMRSTPNEIRWMVERELERREAEGIAGIQELPHPEGAQVVPVVVMNAPCGD